MRFSRVSSEVQLCLTSGRPLLHHIGLVGLIGDRQLEKVIVLTADCGLASLHPKVPNLDFVIVAVLEGVLEVLPPV